MLLDKQTDRAPLFRIIDHETFFNDESVLCGSSDRFDFWHYYRIESVTTKNLATSGESHIKTVFVYEKKRVF